MHFSLMAYAILCDVFSFSCNNCALNGKYDKMRQIKSFIILAELRRSLNRVGGAHLRVIALGQHSPFEKMSSSPYSQ